MQEILGIIYNILVPHFDYNTRIVVFGVIVYSIGCVFMGNFMILQKRSLFADVLSHAAFPGLIVIFIVMVLSGLSVISKSLFILLLGAVMSAVFAIVVMKLLQKHTRIKSDAIQASILGLFFGGGVAMLGIAQRLPEGTVAGMFTYIYGNTASMQKQDAYLFVFSSLLILLFIIWKKRAITIFCFDGDYAYSLGMKSTRLDIALLLLTMFQVIVGLQAIGLLMVSAMFIIPVVAAKFWTHRLRTLMILSVVFAIVCGYVGAVVSANAVNFPTGAVIVIVMEIVFVFSLFFGTQKGIIANFYEKRQFQIKVNVEHTLRIMFEMIEQESQNTNVSINIQDIIPLLHLSDMQCRRRIRYMQAKNYLVVMGDTIRLTSDGICESKRVLRNHRLWEAYLLYYTNAAPEHVDFSADKVEHILGESLTYELEHLLKNAEGIKHNASGIIQEVDTISLHNSLNKKGDTV